MENGDSGFLHAAYLCDLGGIYLGNHAVYCNRVEDVALCAFQVKQFAGVLSLVFVDCHFVFLLSLCEYNIAHSFEECKDFLKISQKKF